MAEILEPQADRTATIADGETNSSAVDLGAMALVGVVFPASWDGGNLGVEVSYDRGDTWIPLTASGGGADLSITEPTETPPRATPLDPADYILGGYVRFVAASAPSGADRTLTLVRRRLY